MLSSISLGIHVSLEYYAKRYHFVFGGELLHQLNMDML